MKIINYIKSLNENEVYSKKARIEFDLYEMRDVILPYLPKPKKKKSKKKGIG